MDRLAELRGSQALTLRELARLSGVDANTINKIELGQRKARPSTVRKLAHALDVSPTEMEKPIDWQARYLKQEAEGLEQLVEVLANARRALDDGRDDYAARFFKLLDDGLRDAAESLHEAHQTARGKEKKVEKSIDDKLSELRREWEAEMA